MRWLKRFAGLALVIALILGLGTFVPRPLFLAGEGEARTRQIYLLSNPIHTDIALPLDADTRAAFGFLSAGGLALDHPGVGYLIFGWGGRAFYLETPTWSELKTVPALKGLTADSAAMHVALGGDMRPGDDVMPLSISERGYRALIAYIQSGFTRDAAGNPIHIGAGYGPYDTFYEGQGTFTALLGCNTWTARGLRAAGLQTGVWNPMPVLLRASLRLYGAPAPR